MAHLPPPPQPQFEDPEETWFVEEDADNEYIPMQPPVNTTVNAETSIPPRPSTGSLRDLATSFAPPRPPVSRVPQETQSLTLHIVGARGLRNADWMPGSGSSDAFVVVKMGDRELHRTEVIQNSLEPFWREEVLVRDWIPGSPLEFVIWDEDYGSSDFLGKVVLESQSFDSVGFNGELPIAEAGRGVSAFLRLKVKLPGKDLPPGPPVDLLVSATRKGLESWGLDLDTQDHEHLYVTGVREGPFQDVNATLRPEEQILRGDFIVSVNSKKGDPAALLNQFKIAPEVHLLLVRSIETTIMFEVKDEQLPLGLQWPTKPAGPSLLITGIDPGGLADAFNKSQDNAMLRIHLQDRIIAVCGFKGKAHELAAKLEGLTKRGVYQISLQRKPDELARQHFGLH